MGDRTMPPGSAYEQVPSESGGWQPGSAVLARWAAALPPGQARAVTALVGVRQGRTYSEAAATLGVSVTTLKTQLRRVRLGHPSVWREVLVYRAAQRAGRHAAALRRAQQHSRRWHRRQFFCTYGYWPRERRRGKA